VNAVLNLKVNFPKTSTGIALKCFHSLEKSIGFIRKIELKLLGHKSYSVVPNTYKTLNFSNFNPQANGPTGR
jgi:hypothetical protein